MAGIEITYRRLRAPSLTGRSLEMERVMERSVSGWPSFRLSQEVIGEEMTGV